MVVASKNARPTEFTYGGAAPKRWTWWTSLATVLATVYSLAGIGQLIDDPKGTNVGAMFIMFGFSALIFGGLALRSRSRLAGHWMIMFATVPALMFFWVLWPPVIALAIIVGAVTEIARATPKSAQTA